MMVTHENRGATTVVPHEKDVKKLEIAPKPRISFSILMTK